MAIWQFIVQLLPRLQLETTFSILPQIMRQETLDDTDWWATVQPPEEFENRLDAWLPRGEVWGGTTQIWGAIDGNRISVTRSSSRVVEIGARIDMRVLE